MTTQEINFAMICGALILICLFAVGLIIHEKSQQKKNLYGNKKSPIQYKKCIGDSFILHPRPSLLRQIQTWLDLRRRPGLGVPSWLGDQCLLLYLRIR